MTFVQRKEKACPPHPSLGESACGKAQVTEDQTHLLRNNRGGEVESGEDGEGGKQKV